MPPTNSDLPLLVGVAASALAAGVAIGLLVGASDPAPDPLGCAEPGPAPDQPKPADSSSTPNTSAQTIADRTASSPEETQPVSEETTFFDFSAELGATVRLPPSWVAAEVEHGAVTFVEGTEAMSSVWSPFIVVSVTTGQSTETTSEAHARVCAEVVAGYRVANRRTLSAQHSELELQPEVVDAPWAFVCIYTTKLKESSTASIQLVLPQLEKTREGPAAPTATENQAFQCACASLLPSVPEQAALWLTCPSDAPGVAAVVPHFTSIAPWEHDRNHILPRNAKAVAEGSTPHDGTSGVALFVVDAGLDHPPATDSVELLSPVQRVLAQTGWLPQPPSDAERALCVAQSGPLNEESMRIDGGVVGTVMSFIHFGQGLRGTCKVLPPRLTAPQAIICLFAWAQGATALCDTLRGSVFVGFSLPQKGEADAGAEGSPATVVCGTTKVVVDGAPWFPLGWKATTLATVPTSSLIRYERVDSAVAAGAAGSVKDVVIALEPTAVSASDAAELLVLEATTRGAKVVYRDGFRCIALFQPTDDENNSKYRLDVSRFVPPSTKQDRRSVTDQLPLVCRTSSGGVVDIVEADRPQATRVARVTAFVGGVYSANEEAEAVAISKRVSRQLALVQSPRSVGGS